MFVPAKILESSDIEKDMFCCSNHILTISTNGICGNFSYTFSTYLPISFVDVFLLDNLFF